MVIKCDKISIAFTKKEEVFVQYLIIINIVIIIVMLLLFFKASSIFKKAVQSNGDLEVEGKKAKKYMMISVALVPISLILTGIMVFRAF